MTDIFVSYRRVDSEWSAGRLYDRLEQTFGKERVFFDTIAIRPGDDFHQVLGDRVGRCRVCLAVIGPKWAAVLQERLADQNDFVRIEISAALDRGVRVIPVLIDGARMPGEADLPPEIRPLSRRNAVALKADRFRADVDQLIEYLKEDLLSSAPAVAVVRDPPGAARSTGSVGFQDHPHGPRMLRIPPGAFEMGPPPDANETQIVDPKQAKVRIEFAKPFCLGAAPVTVSEFMHFVEQTGYDSALFGLMVRRDGKLVREPGRHFASPGFEQAGNFPAVGLSWHDASAYVKWLAAETGLPYRLVSEAEWEYAARAGLTRLGASMQYDPRGDRAANTVAPTQAVDTWSPNPWGMHLVYGNVWEWCEDIWQKDYADLPTDGRPRTKGKDADLRVVRGGVAGTMPLLSRATGPSLKLNAERYGDLGFRVARDS